MTNRIVYVQTSFYNSEGIAVQKQPKMVYFLKNEDGTMPTESDLARWFEDAYPMDGKCEKKPDGTFVGYRRHNFTKGYAKYVMTIGDTSINCGEWEAVPQ